MRYTPVSLLAPDGPAGEERAAVHISIIGAGRVGTTLGRRWSEGGHVVTYGVRDPGDARHAALGSVALPADAVAGADVVVIALPWAAVAEVAPALEVGDAVVVDATNPLGPDARQLLAPSEGSGAEAVARWTGSSRVVKAFNTTGSANMADPGEAPVRPMMLLAGDDDEAKATVGSLAAALGFEPVDGGPLAAAADLEHVAALWIRLAYRLGRGPGIAFALVQR
jgi:predicted dinucleotide-binding enzyme